MARDELTFKERIDVFLNYLRLFGFLAVVAAGGYWWYGHQAKQRSAENTSTAPNALSEDSSAAAAPVTAASKASAVWKPVIDHAVASVYQPLDEQPVDVPTGLAAAENVTRGRIKAAGSGLPSWQIGQRIGSEIRAVAAEREKSAKNLQPITAAPNQARAAKVSAAQLADDEERRKFFAGSVKSRWSVQVAQRTTRINALYQQLLVEEARNR